MRRLANPSSCASAGRGPTVWRAGTFVTVALVLVDAMWMVIQGWTIQVDSAVGVLLAAGLVLTVLLVPRYRHDEKISCVVGAAALLIVFSAASAALSYLVVSTGAPLTDASLAAADRALHFDWLATHAWLSAHPGLRAVLRLAYFSGLPQIALIVLFLGFSGRGVQLEGFIASFIGVTLFSIALSAFIPAAGPWAYYGLAPHLVDASAMSHFEPLRAGSLRHIDLSRMQGLISIPSMHTAIAILVAYAMRSAGTWTWVFAALNLAMIVATPIEGGHYLIDVPAGAALAVVLIGLQRRRRSAVQPARNPVNFDSQRPRHSSAGPAASR